MNAVSTHCELEIESLKQKLGQLEQSIKELAIVHEMPRNEKFKQKATSLAAQENIMFDECSITLVANKFNENSANYLKSNLAFPVSSNADAIMNFGFCAPFDEHCSWGQESENLTELVIEYADVKIIAVNGKRIVTAPADKDWPKYTFARKTRFMTIDEFAQSPKGDAYLRFYKMNGYDSANGLLSKDEFCVGPNYWPFNDCDNILTPKFWDEFETFFSYEESRKILMRK